ncbi:amino acid ABC transporter substrate-binding protein [Azonexus sp.]|uniref:amino acid ABC transporter substrate-binding protein n=1 Tax=Azonexus sp. TaxID=1872668 RepID=UPI0027B975E6|nr:amino acid ABC transporter substrate-binding protein [Azonexus sp.]
MNKTLVTAGLLFLSLISLPAQAGKTLDSIRQRGEVICGVNEALVGFSVADAKGEWHGIDVDVCRAIAAATLGDARKVRWVPLNKMQLFPALQSGEVDILSHNVTWTMTRDAAMGMHFTSIVFYDGQGFMVARKSGIQSLRDLENTDICVQSGTTTEKNLSDYFRARKMKFRSVVFANFEASIKAFLSGRCQSYTTDATSLLSLIQRASRTPGDYVVLPELISKEPLSPAVRRGDDEWFAIVKWVINALITAEEEGITQANVEQQKVHGSASAQRLLGHQEDTGKLIGLDREWAARAIAAVGNYGEVFDRNLGAGSPLNLPRGLNRLWRDGGLLYAPPIR